jgi:hypothetical protein
METVAVLVIGTALGSVLGYGSVLLRVWRLEKELAQALLQVSVLGSVLESRTELDSEWVWVQKSEWESVKVKQSELEMALDLANSKAMWKE